MTATQTAAALCNRMSDLQSGKITPDAYRAFVREHRPRFDSAEWQRIQFAAVARDSHK